MTAWTKSFAEARLTVLQAEDVVLLEKPVTTATTGSGGSATTTASGNAGKITIEGNNGGVRVTTGDGAVLQANRIVLDPGGARSATTATTQAGAETQKAEGVFYVMGVPHSGGFMLAADRKMGIVDGLKITGFKVEEAKDATVTLIRRQKDDSERRMVFFLDELLQDPRKDVLLQTDDVLIVEAGGASPRKIVAADARHG